MDDPEVIEISSGESDGEAFIDRRTILQPVVSRVVDALGGYENGVYRLGDEVGACLKDLKKLWRKDDTDDERTVARIFWETRVLPNDLIPILLVTAGQGLVEDKRAIAAADLMTAMTWPIDMAEELQELDEELDKGTDYTQLLQSHLHYKSALLKPGVIEALFGIMLPPLAKHAKERTERDGQVVNIVLHLIRNLAFIKDLPSNMHLSADQAEFSSLQSKLIRTLSETHILQLLLTIAANTTKDPLMNGWNTLVLEIFYLLFRGIKPSSLTMDQSKQPADRLQSLLALEERSRREIARKASSRHSRFGTTIAVKLNPKAIHRPPKDDNNGNDADAESSTSSRPLVLHRQQALNAEAGSIWDMTKRQKTKKLTTVDQLTRQDNLSVEAKHILQNLAIEFIESCFNPFLSALLKDIRSERVKIVEKDHLRLLYVTKWMLDFFLSMRAKDKSTAASQRWHFGLVAEVTEREWIIWVLKRMREAVEDKPKLWTELQAGIECLTQLLLLIDNMSSSEISDPTLNDAAELLQQQLVYNGEVLDITLESLRVYKEGTQSLAYLDSSVHMAYVLLRMLERWSKGKGDMYVRRKKAKARKRKGDTEEDGIPDVEEDDVEVEEETREITFTFEAFEAKFASAEVTRTLLLYLASYKDFSSSENMKRVVSLMHRQAVRAKAEGLFFKVSTLDQFKSILADQKSFPREQPYKDLVSLINFILRQFFKALAENSFLAIEAFFPKNRGHWKQYSSWEPEKKSSRAEKTVLDTRFPPDVQVKKGYSWSDQLGIVIAALVETSQNELVDWVRDILTVVIDQRKRIVEETDSKDDDSVLEDGNEDVGARLTLTGPSSEAVAKFTDYLIPYLSDEQADAATKNPKLKLLFRLSKFYILDEDADELEWYVPAAILPSDLQGTLTVINQFLEKPIDLEGKTPSQLLGKKTRRRRVRAPSDSDADDDAVDVNEPKRRKKKEKKKAEKEQYKSAQFIEDSDGEYGNIEAFLQQEKEKREKVILSTENGGQSTTMRATGTKKRRRKAPGKGDRKKRKGEGASAITATEIDEVEDRQTGGSGSDVSEVRSSPEPIVPSERPRPRPRPRPKPVDKPDEDNHDASPNESVLPDDGDLADSPTGNRLGSKKKKGRLIISDEDD